MVLTVDGDTKYYNTSDVKASINQASGAFTVSSKDNAWFDTYVGKVSNVSFVKAQLETEDGEIDNTDKAKVSLKTAQSWFQSAFVEWLPYEGATTYNVYVKGGQYSDFTKIDYQLVRDYGSYGRADALGLKAGEYELKVVPVVNDKEVVEAANIATGLKVRAHDRSGFAFNTSKTPGAYNADGTLKSGAVVVYLTNDNIDKVTLDVQTSSKGDKTTCTGLQNIINNGIKKGIDTRPFVFRMIGQIKTPSVADKGDIVIDMNGKDVSAGVTIEGVGNDAVADGWGIRLKGARYAEVSNIGFFNCSSGEGDNVGLQQDNEHIWVHNCDMFYGDAGSDADQIKGDGALDCKKSNYVTFSYNHFWDNGKCNLLGLSEGSTDYYITYHHNWYDHSDSRHPRVRYYSAHVYNNYYDGNAKYGVGSTLGSSVFVENNYFRNTNKPMMISQQGTDIKGNPKGTFSGEDGGIIKAYGNVFADMKSLRFVPYSENQTEFDAYVASSRGEQVPASVTSKKGGNKYNNFDTNSSLFYSSYVLDKAEDVPAVVAGQFGAGRVQHGDFQWTFNNSVDDAEYEVNKALKAAVSAYKTSLVKIFGGENIDVPGTDPTPTPDPDPNPGTDPTPSTPEIEGTVTCTFSGTSSNIVASNSAFTFTGTKHNAKTEDTTIDGVTYKTSLKMESGTEVTFTTKQKMTLYVYYGASGTSKTVLVDGAECTGDPTTVTLEAGTHKIARKVATTVALIKLVPVTTE
ncbi:MAG: pectate lyase [Prevotella sp.]|nr:pectate lyase [Prevotella sp.]